MTDHVDLHFDPWAFAKSRPHAVSAETGIAYSDFWAMHFAGGHQTGKHGRKLPIPQWAMNDDTLRQVVVTYLERRTYTDPKEEATLGERLNAVQKNAERLAANFRDKLRDHIDRYRDVPPKSQRFLAVEIANMDTQIVLASRIVAVVLAVPYLSYRLDYTSVEVAEALGIKPPHVRILLYRLNKIWKHITGEIVLKLPNRKGRPKKLEVERALALRECGWSWAMIGQEFDIKDPRAAVWRQSRNTGLPERTGLRFRIAVA